MKTVAIAAVLMMLAVPTWADEAENRQANGPANTDEPIVLSEAEMDSVTAGDRRKAMLQDLATLSSTRTTSATGENSLYGDFFGLDDLWTGQ